MACSRRSSCSRRRQVAATGGVSPGGVSECLSRGELPRLTDAAERAVETTRLYGELSVLRARNSGCGADRVDSHQRHARGRGWHGPGDEPRGPDPGGGTRVGGGRRAPVRRAVRPGPVEDVKTFVKRVCSGTPGQVRFAGRGIDGQPRTFELRAVPLRRDWDTASALGVCASHRWTCPRRDRPFQTDADIEVEIPLDGLAEPPRVDAVKGAAFETLKLELEAERARTARHAGAPRHAGCPAPDVGSGLERRPVGARAETDAAVQPPAMEREHEVTRALLEQALREKDAELLRLADDRETVMERARAAEHDAARLRESLARAAGWQAELEDATRVRRQLELRLGELETQATTAAGERDAARADVADRTARLTGATIAREDLAARLTALEAEAAAAAGDRDAARTGLEQATAQLEAATRARGEFEARLAALHQEATATAEDCDAARTGLDRANAELAQLRAVTDAHTHEQAALLDVRQQVARLQAAATTVEQQRRALDEAHDQLDRLRGALEDALGARTDIERQLHEKESAAADCASGGCRRRLDGCRGGRARGAPLGPLGSTRPSRRERGDGGRPVAGRRAGRSPGEPRPGPGRGRAPHVRR